MSDPVPPDTLPKTEGTLPFGLVGAGPLRAPALVIEEHYFTAGLYIAYGVTGSGKSVTTASVAALASRAGYNGAFLYMYEARQPSGFLTETASTDGSLVPRPPDEWLDAFLKEWPQHCKDANPYGMKPFWDTLPELDPTLGRVVADIPGTDYKPGPGRKLGLIVLDSITIPLRMYKADKKEGRRGEPTMQGGLQPSDVAFVVSLNQFALKNGVVIIGVVNLDLVPFAPKLEAMCEGLIEVSKPGTIKMRNRFYRNFKEIAIPEDVMNQVGNDIFGYSKPDTKKEPSLSSVFGSYDVPTTSEIN